MPEPTPAAATETKKKAAPKKAKPAAVPAAPEKAAPKGKGAAAPAGAKAKKAPKAKAEPTAAAEPEAPRPWEAVAAKAAPIFGRVDEATLQVLGYLHESPMTRGQVLDAYEGEAKVLDEMLADLTGTGFVAVAGKKLAPTERGRALWALAQQVAEG